MGLSDRELGVSDMASTTWSLDLRRPIYATRVLCEVANEREVAKSEILAGTGIGPEDFNDPEALATPIPRRSATHSRGGTESRRAGIPAAARPSATGRRPWRRRSGAGPLAASAPLR